MKLWDHQQESVDIARTMDYYALFFEPGCGKSGAVITMLKEKMNTKRRILRTLLFTPPMVCPQFKEEFKLFSKLDPRRVVLLTGSGKKRLKTFMKHAYTSQGERQGCVFITNYEALLMKPLYKAMMEWEAEAFILDESHKLKSTSATRSKLAFDLCNPFDHKNGKWVKRPLVYLLTGTPVLNSPMDVFQQIKIMMGGFPTKEYFETMGDKRYLIDNFYVFRPYYFVDRNKNMPKNKYFPCWEPMTLVRDGRDAIGEIKSILERIGKRVLKIECLDLPPEIPIITKVGMTTEQSKAYTELERDFITYMSGGFCEASLALTKSLRLMEVTSGYLPLINEETDDKVVESYKNTPKDEVLIEMLESMVPQNKVLLWACWRENYVRLAAILKKLGIQFVEVHGAISDSKKRKNVQAFKTDPAISVMLGHPGSGGIGLNLTVAQYSIFYSRTFSLEHYLQARARNHRGGAKEAGHTSITHYDLVCEKTLDELILGKLQGKIDVSASLLGDLARDLQKMI